MSKVVASLRAASHDSDEASSAAVHQRRERDGGGRGSRGHRGLVIAALRQRGGKVERIREARGCGSGDIASHDTARTHDGCHDTARTKQLARSRTKKTCASHRRAGPEHPWAGTPHTSGSCVGGGQDGVLRGTWTV